MFDHILNWRLLNGSHPFPSLDGGTCINEAAVVVAGFPYRKIDNANDCPPCFSRVIATYAIKLNDAMPDDLRQDLLLPFVTRLAGSADLDVVERARADLIVVRTVNWILPIVLRRYHNDCLAAHCERVTTRQEASEVAHRARDKLRAAASTADADAAVYVAAAAVYAAAAAAANAAVYAAANAAVYAADAAANAANAATRRQIWTISTNILDVALKVGQQAKPIEAALVRERADKAKIKRVVA